MLVLQCREITLGMDRVMRVMHAWVPSALISVALDHLLT